MDNPNVNYRILRNLYNVSFSPFLSWLTKFEEDKPEIVKDSNSYAQRQVSTEQLSTKSSMSTSTSTLSSEVKLKNNGASNVHSVNQSEKCNVSLVLRKRNSLSKLSHFTVSCANLQDTSENSKSTNSPIMPSSFARSDSVSTLADVGPIKRKRILIIDNVTIESKLLSRLLQKRGHYCEEVISGKKGIDTVKTSLSSDTENIDADDLRKKTYDVVLMNLQMAEPSGIETAQGMRDIGYTGAIIGVITCLPDEKDEFLQAGVTNIISKPYKLNQMNAIIDSL